MSRQNKSLHALSVMAGSFGWSCVDTVGRNPHRRTRYFLVIRGPRNRRSKVAMRYKSTFHRLCLVVDASSALEHDAFKRNFKLTRPASRCEESRSCECDGRVCGTRPSVPRPLGAPPGLSSYHHHRRRLAIHDCPHSLLSTEDICIGSTHGARHTWAIPIRRASWGSPSPAFIHQQAK